MKTILTLPMIGIQTLRITMEAIHIRQSAISFIIIWQE